MALEKLVQDVQTASASAEGAPARWSEVRRQLCGSQVTDLIKANPQEHDAALQALDPAAHTMGWLAILGSQDGPVRPEDLPSFLSQAERLLTAFSPEQARVWPERFVSICRRYTDALVQNAVPGRGVAPVRSALLRFQPDATTLTPLHAMLAKLCLLAYMHVAMVPILDTEISAISPAATATDVEDVLLYFYYGGMIYMGLRRFEDARDMFLGAVTAPAMAASAIAVEAYKKYVLCSILANGSVASLPKYTSNVLLRVLRNKCQAYDHFAEAFKAHDSFRAKHVAQRNESEYAQDGNTGLMKCCLRELDRRKLLRLTRTYITLSLSDIAQHVGLASTEDAEKMLLEMIECDMIQARISQEDSMVSFTEAPDNFDTPAAMQAINDSINKVLAINEKVDALNTSLLTSQAYQAKLKSGGGGGGRRARGMGPHGGGGGAMGMALGGPGSESERELYAD